MNKRKKKLAALFLTAALPVTLLMGCKESTADTNETVSQDTASDSAAGKKGGMMGTGGSVEGVDQNLELTQSEVNQEFTDRDKDSSYEDEDIVEVTLNDTSIEAKEEGCSISGSTLTISKEGTYRLRGTLEDGQIIVDGADTDKIRIVLDGAEIHCETSAAIYVKNADKTVLTLAGESKNTLSGGSEYVQTDDNTVDGVIFSKDDLTVNGSGSLEIDAPYKHGIVSKNDLVFTGGEITVEAVGQCLSGKDCIKIADGIFKLSGQSKGLKSENTEETEKGNIYVSGGTFTVDTEDDAFHSSGSIVIDGGEFTVTSGDDAFHSDLDMVVNGGTISVGSCYEGLEGLRVVINGGDIVLTADDDGINAAKSSTEEEAADVRGGSGDGGMENETEAYIKITGGNLSVSAEGDGLDSNGSLFVSGGTTYVNGPVSAGDSALDYNGGAQITGGTVIAVGSSGMAEGFGDSSTQCSIMQNLEQNQEAASPVILTDSEGKELLNWTPGKTYSSVILSCPGLEIGQSYTLNTGTESTELTLESLATSNGSAFGQMGGGMGRGKGGAKGERPEGTELPAEGEMPEGAEPPADGEMPEGMNPPAEGEIPEGMNPPTESGTSGNDASQEASESDSI